MARKYEFRVNQHALAMEICEEQVTIAAFSEIEGRVHKQPWPEHFKYHFFTQGVGVGMLYIEHINQVRNRIGLQQIHFQETHPQDYCRLRDNSLKARRRSEWLRDYNDMDTAEQVAWFRTALDTMKTLPPPLDPSQADQPPMSYAHHRELKRHFDGNMWSAAERARRAGAISPPSIEAVFVPVGTSDVCARIIRQLELAQSLPEPSGLIGEIVANLEPETALNIANQFQDAIIRSALIRRSMMEA